jgi:hypothetical protein
VGETSQSAFQTLVKVMEGLGYLRSPRVFDAITAAEPQAERMFRIRPASFDVKVLSGARCFDTRRSWEIEAQFLPHGQSASHALETEVLPEEDRIVNALGATQIVLRINGSYGPGDLTAYTKIQITAQIDYERTLS